MTTKTYIKKGRLVGAQHPKAKLTDDQVRLARRMHRPGIVGYQAIAETIGAGISTIRDICTYRTRRDVVMESPQAHNVTHETQRYEARQAAAARQADEPQQLHQVRHQANHDRKQKTQHA